MSTMNPGWAEVFHVNYEPCVGRSFPCQLLYSIFHSCIKVFIHKL